MACIWASASRPSRLTSTSTETLSTESRFTADGAGRVGIGFEETAGESTDRGCTRPNEHAPKPRNRRVTRKHHDWTATDVGHLAPPHLTRPEVHSRGASRTPPRGQVAPRVGLISRVVVIRNVAGVHLSGSMASQQRPSASSTSAASVRPDRTLRALLNNSGLRWCSGVCDSCHNHATAYAAPGVITGNSISVSAEAAAPATQSDFQGVGAVCTRRDHSEIGAATV